MRPGGRVAAWGIAGALAAGGVAVLRDATQSTHYVTGPDTALRVVIDARSNRIEAHQTLDELTAGLVQFCRLEVTSEQVSDLEVLRSEEPRRFAVYLRPALDSTDRKQFTGCLEDWTLDHHLITVVSLTDIDAADIPSTLITDPTS